MHLLACELRQPVYTISVGVIAYILKVWVAASTLVQMKVCLQTDHTFGIYSKVAMARYTMHLVGLCIKTTCVYGTTCVIMHIPKVWFLLWVINTLSSSCRCVFRLITNLKSNVNFPWPDTLCILLACALRQPVYTVSVSEIT